MCSCGECGFGKQRLDSSRQFPLDPRLYVRKEKLVERRKSRLFSRATAVGRHLLSAARGGCRNSKRSSTSGVRPLEQGRLCETGGLLLY